MDAQAALLGLDLPGPKEPETFAVWPENWPAVELFSRCMSQWRVTMGGVVGLDYGVVLQLMALYDVQDRRRVLEEVQIMEERAVEIINERSQSEAKS